MAEEQEQAQSIDEMVRKYLHLMIQRRWWIVAPTVVVALLACGASTVIPNRYTSEATILIVHQQVPERYVTPNNTSDFHETLLLVQDAILSRTQLLQIVNDFDLYPKQRKRLAPEDLVDLIHSDIMIAPLERTASEKDLNSFKISFTGADPHIAQDVTERLTTLFVEGDLRTQVEQSMGTTQFLDERLKAAGDDLKTQEARVRDFKMRYLGQLPEQREGNLAILSNLHAQLENTLSTLSHTREQQVYYETLISQYKSLSSAGVSIAGPSVASPTDAAKTDLARLKNERLELLARYTEQYPDVVKIEQQIKDTEAQVAAAEKAAQAAKEEAGKAKASTPSTSTADVTLAQFKSQLEVERLQIEHATADEKSLEAQIADYTSRLNMTPVREQQLADMLRDYDLSKKNYDDLMGKKTQSELATRLQERQQGQQFRVVDAPSLPIKPSSPIHLKIALGGLAAGLGCGVGLVLLLETVNHSLVSEKELAQYFSFPLMVGIPALPTLKEKRKRWRWHAVEWVVVTTLCFLVCASELYIYRRG